MRRKCVVDERNSSVEDAQNSHVLCVGRKSPVQSRVESELNVCGAGMNAPRHGQGLLPESVIWSYIVQLSSALRTIHAHGLACRVMDPTKILFTDKSRYVAVGGSSLIDSLVLECIRKSLSCSM